MREESFTDLLRDNYQVIKEVLEETMQSHFNGNKLPEKYDKTIYRSLYFDRKLFPKQIEFVCAVEEYLEDNKCCIGFSDTGTGKTAMTHALASLSDYDVVFIEVPPHLVDKTANEINVLMKSNFDYDIVIVESFKDVISLTKKGQKIPHFKTIYIVSKEKAKTSYPTVQAFNSRRTRKTGTLENPVTKKEETVKWTQRSFHCTNCGCEIDAVSEDEYMKYIEDKECTQYEADLHFFPSKKIMTKCKNCHEVIAGPKTAESSFKNFRDRISKYGSNIQYYKPKVKNHNIGVYELLKRYGVKKRIGLGVTDEFHESKGADSERGNGTSTLISMSRKYIGLTGTLLGGYASDIFYLLYRLFPDFMKNELGLDWHNVIEFEEMFGGIEEHFDVANYDEITGKFQKGKRSFGKRKRADLSPRLFDAIMPFCVFLRLDEIKFFEGSSCLPPYTEHKHIIKAEEEFLESYYDYARQIVEVVKEEAEEKKLIRDKKAVETKFLIPTNGMRKLGKAALLIPDKMYDTHEFKYEVSEMTIDPITKKPVKESIEKTVTYFPPFDKDLYPLNNKNRKLLEIINDNYQRGRKVLVYCDFVGDGVREEIADTIKRNSNYCVEILPNEIPARKRDKYIKSLSCDVLITNPERVKTGLDLLEYPTIVYMEQAYTTYNVFTLRQASKRSWRIGQEQNVEVHAIVYASTQQHTAFTMMGGKINTSAGIEGRLSTGEDMASMAEDENLQIAMARAIMQEQYGENKSSLSSTHIDLNAREWTPFEEYYLEHLKAFEIEPSLYEEHKPKCRVPVITSTIKVSKPVDIDSIEVETEVICNETTMEDEYLLPIEHNSNVTSKPYQPSLFDF